MSVGVNSAPCSVTRTARGPRSSCPLTERVAERVPPPCRLLFPRRRFPSVPVCRLQTRCSQPTGRRRRDRTASPDAAPALLCPTRPGPECPAPPGARPCGAACGRGWRSVLELCRPSVAPGGAAAAVRCSGRTVAAARVLGVRQSAVNAPRARGSSVAAPGTFPARPEPPPCLSSRGGLGSERAEETVGD